MSTFMPDFSTMPASNGYRALYRLFDEQSWRMVIDRATKKPAVFDTQFAAITAAKDVVRLKLNPQIRSEASPIEPEEDDKDLLAMEEWRTKKQEEYAAIRALVKNGKNRRRFVVEKKQRRGK
jgi:uncharacterized protein YgiM (DUF1202 family)